MLRVATLDDGPASADHESTWLLGHTDRISFDGSLWAEEGDVYVEAFLHVPCRYFDSKDGGRASCRAHRFEDIAPLEPEHRRSKRRLAEDRFRIVQNGREVTRHLPPPARPPRELPLHAGSNPCVGAPCRTADNRQGAACCRDLQIEIMCTKRERRLESLVRARKSPYLCKVDRESPFSLSAEIISACGYLLEDGVHCALHGRRRKDGRPAKPDLCSEWPDGAEVTHPGCVFAKA